MLTKYMRRIPKSIYEAAEIDGAGEWQIFTKICLPNCRGGIASIAILLFIDYWNMVEQPLILLSDDQLHPLSVFLSKMPYCKIKCPAVLKKPPGITGDPDPHAHFIRTINKIQSPKDRCQGCGRIRFGKLNGYQLYI